MKIEVLEFKEQEDGSAIVEWAVDDEAKRFLLEHAIKDLLLKAVEQDKNLNESLPE